MGGGGRPYNAEKRRCAVGAVSAFSFAVCSAMVPRLPTLSLSTSPADHDDFKNKRKDHYNMKAAMDRARRLMEEEEEGQS